MEALKSFELFTSRWSVTSQKTFKLQQQRWKNLKPRLQIISSEGSEMLSFNIIFGDAQEYHECTHDIHELHFRQHTPDYS